MSFRNPKMPKYAATHYEMTRKTKNIVRNVQLKWMNLSKIRQDKNISDKKCNLSLRLVLFCSPSAVFFNRPSTVVFIDSETYETVPLQCPRCFQFSTRKTPLYGLSLICRATRKARVLQVARTVKGGNSDWKYHFSQTWRIIVRVWSI